MRFGTDAREERRDERPGTRQHGASSGRAAPGRRIRVLLCDDHAIVREGIADALSLRSDGVEIVGQAADGAEAVERARALRPDVVIMDLSMPVMDGFEAMARIRANVPEARILVLTASVERGDVLNALREQASGYVLKDDPTDRFVHAIQVVADGGSYLSPGPNTLRTRTEPWDDLDERDRRILRMVAEGKKNAEIARELHIAERTAKHHLSRICRTLNAENRTMATAIAIEHGIIGRSG
jgi:DNA-binding NarL/FixJ family response regulator